MAAKTKSMTAAELLTRPDDHLRHELIAGELRSMPLHGGEHGAICAALAAALATHVRRERLGRLVAGGVGLILATGPDTVRAADVAFVRRERVEAEGRLTGYRRGAPNLVAEIVSPDDRYLDVQEKVAAWLEGGA